MVVKIGILGCGRMGQRHAEAYAKISDANVIAFADVDVQKAGILAEKFHKKSVLISELFTDPSIDAISICTPNSLHFENSITALKNGKHVLVEKPMALSLSDCDEMNRVAKENNLNLMVGQTYRYYPSSQKAKAIIDSGEIGEIKLIMGYGLDPGSLPGKTKTPDWALNSKFGGGVFFDAIHGIDLFRYWTNSEISSVYVPIMDKLFDDFSAEQLGIATLTFSNGVVATIMPVAPTWGIRDTGIKIIGKKGALYVT